jgi:hypothetical protein
MIVRVVSAANCQLLQEEVSEVARAWTDPAPLEPQLASTAEVPHMVHGLSTATNSHVAFRGTEARTVVPVEVE